MAYAVTVLKTGLSYLCVCCVVDPILPKMLLRIEQGNLESSSAAGLLENNTTYYSSSPNSTAGNLNQGGKFGFLVAAKGAAQFICNPFVGHVTSRYDTSNTYLHIYMYIYTVFCMYVSACIHFSIYGFMSSGTN